MKPVWLTMLGLYGVNRHNEISAMATTIFQGGKTKQIEPSPRSLSLCLSVSCSFIMDMLLVCEVSITVYFSRTARISCRQ